MDVSRIKTLLVGSFRDRRLGFRKRRQGGDTYVSVGGVGVGARWVFGDRLGGTAFFVDTGFMVPTLPILKLGVYFNRFHISLQPFQPLAWFADEGYGFTQFTVAAGYDIHLGK